MDNHTSAPKKFGAGIAGFIGGVLAIYIGRVVLSLVLVIGATSIFGDSSNLAQDMISTANILSLLFAFWVGIKIYKKMVYSKKA